MGRRVDWHEDRPTGDEAVPARPRLRRLARTIGLAGGGVCVVGVLAVFVFPTRTFLEQREATSESQRRLDVIEEQNKVMEDRIAELDDPGEIERLAREQYNLVLPGEEAYAVLPPPLPPLDLPTLWPFGSLLQATSPAP
jgi:hypothetical protein